MAMDRGFCARVLRGVAAVLLLGAGLAGRAAAEDVVADLGAVRFIERFEGSDSGRELLKRNGFAVVPRFYHRMSGPYADMDTPHFITTDSVHNTFHVIFETLLKEAEAGWLQTLKQLAAQTRNGLAGKAKGPIAGLLPQDHPARRLAEDYLHVVECLLSEDAPPDSAPEAVREEVTLATAAAGVARSPLFHFDVDYSLFKPRGFYEGNPRLERYFRAMSWCGNLVFRAKDERESLAALLLAETVTSFDPARTAWDRLNGFYTRLLAPSDDLTPVEYAALLPALGDCGTAEEAWAAFQRAAETLRPPRINGQALSPGEMADWQSRTKGMCLLGKRHTPENAAFMILTDPEVPGRLFPSGLDVLAAAGSPRARELTLVPSPDRPAHERALDRAGTLFREFSQTPEPTHYARILGLLDTLRAPAPPEAPAFMRTDAYGDKNLMTALSVWASLRHAWALHAKQSVEYLCFSEVDPVIGYVEPNPAFFQAMHDLIAETDRLFSEVPGVDLSKLKELGVLMERLTGILQKQQAGVPVSDRDSEFLRAYGYTISDLQGFYTNHIADEEMPWAAMVTDVHTELSTGECLEVGVGGIMPVYVVLERNGVQELLVGGVCPYYEFTQPITNRLTDAEWRDRWEVGDVPPLPAWTASFVAGQRPAAGVTAQIREGKRPSEAAFLGDPEFLSFLEQAVQPQGELYLKDNYDWTLSLAAKKLGRKLFPYLMDQLRTAPLDQSANQRPCPVRAAAWALRLVVAPEDLPALREIMLCGEERRSSWASFVLYGLDTDTRTDFLLDLYSAPDASAISGEVMEDMGHAAGVSALPRLLDLWKSGDIPAKLRTADTIAEIWVPEYPEMRMMLHHAPDRLTDKERAALDAKVRRCILETLRLDLDAISPQQDRRFMLDMGGLRKDLFGAAGRLKLEEAIPILAAERDRFGIPRETLEGLAVMNTERSLAALTELTRVADSSELCDILRILEQAKCRQAVPRLRELLDFTQDEGCVNSRRVCDQATRTLAAIFPEGPGVEEDGDTNEEQKDAKVAAWKAYLDGLPAAAPGAAAPKATTPAGV